MKHKNCIRIFTSTSDALPAYLMSFSTSSNNIESMYEGVQKNIFDGAASVSAVLTIVVINGNSYLSYKKSLYGSIN